MRSHSHDGPAALSDALRGAIADTHRDLERTPLAEALASGGVTRQRYAALAWQMWHLHRGVEPAFERAASAWPALRTAWQPSRARLPLIEADLRVLGVGGPPPVHPAVAEALARIDLVSAQRPWAVVGPLYVLEGSRLGSTIVGRAVARGWGVIPAPGIGLDYHLPPPAGWWASTVAALDALALDACASADACEAAVALMTSLRHLYIDLVPAMRSDGPGEVVA